MANQLEQQLSEAGKKLQQLPHSKDALLKILKQVAINLSEVDQSPSQTMMKAMRPSMNALITPELLRHRDRDVTLLVATCISEITRITAPEAPYNDDVLRVISLSCKIFFLRECQCPFNIGDISFIHLYNHSFYDYFNVF